MEKLKNLFTQYKHGLIAAAYLIFYLNWFFWLEQKVTRHYTIIHVDVDDYIPFCEVFIIPYLLWFAYVAVTVLYLLFTNKSDYYKACAFLFTGMTIFLIISTLWPNGHHLRPLEMPRDNIFTHFVEGLYSRDTSTNLWPSIHVFNSIGAHIAISHCKTLKNKKGLQIGSLILAVSIILSTVFLKQHSVFDVLTAFVMAAVLYVAVYKWDILALISSIGARRKAKPQME